MTILVKALVCLIVSCLLLPGCLPKKTDIVQLRADTFKLRREGDNSLELRQQIWHDAETFCSKKDQYLMLTNKDFNQNYYEITFRCLSAGDPELQRNESSLQKKRNQKTLGGYGKYEY